MVKKASMRQYRLSITNYPSSSLTGKIIIAEKKDIDAFAGSCRFLSDFI